MVSEKRYSERKPIDLEVVVSYAHVGLFRANVQDASQTGMYITSSTVEIPVQATVVVTFVCPEEGQPSCVNANGVVVHQSQQGFGLTFDSLDDDCTKALGLLLAS